MEIYALIFGFLGLLIGSFLNVVIYRVPRGESIAFPGSHCPACGHFLRAWEIIPVLSFLILRGHCSKCKLAISWRYPAIELLTGILFYYTVRQYDELSVRIAFDLLFVSFLIALSFIDIDTYRLPDVLVLPLWVIGIVHAFFSSGQVNWLSSLIGTLTAGGAFWLIAKFYPKGMGWGDVKFVAALGAYLGFPQIFLVIFLASLTGSVIGFIFLLLKGQGLKQQIPFGPYLVLGGLISLYWGEKIVGNYWQWMLR